MWIMGQNQTSLFDSRRFVGIHIYTVVKDVKYFISGIEETGNDIDLAEYSSEERAKSVLLDLLANLDKVRYVMPPD